MLSRFPTTDNYVWEISRVDTCNVVETALVPILATCPFYADCVQMWHKLKESPVCFYVRSRELLRSHNLFGKEGSDLLVWRISVI
jgi:hypothetical protein